MEDVIVIDNGPHISGTLVAILATVIAAICIWLTVRFINRRARR